MNQYPALRRKPLGRAREERIEHRRLDMLDDIGHHDRVEGVRGLPSERVGALEGEAICFRLRVGSLGNRDGWRRIIDTENMRSVLRESEAQLASPAAEIEKALTFSWLRKRGERVMPNLRQATPVALDEGIVTAAIGKEILCIVSVLQGAIVGRARLVEDPRFQERQIRIGPAHRLSKIETVLVLKIGKRGRLALIGSCADDGDEACASHRRLQLREEVIGIAGINRCKRRLLSDAHAKPIDQPPAQGAPVDLGHPALGFIGEKISRKRERRRFLA
jgi:hypothetical protein